MFGDYAEHLSLEDQIELKIQKKLNKAGIKGHNKLNVSWTVETLFNKIDSVIDEEVQKYKKEEELKITGLTLAELQFNLPYNIVGYNLYFSGGGYSWRGDYSILALDIQSENTGDGLSLSDLLDISDIEGEYEGWKGGTYYLGENTEMKLAMEDGWSNDIFIDSAKVIDGVVQITLGFGKGYEGCLNEFRANEND